MKTSYYVLLLSGVLLLCFYAAPLVIKSPIPVTLDAPSAQRISTAQQSQQDASNSLLQNIVDALEATGGRRFERSDNRDRREATKSMRVVATDFDTRDLSQTTDNVGIWGTDGTNVRQLLLNSSGYVETNIVNTPTVTVSGGTITGTVATGSDASSVNPILSGGIDDSSNARPFKTDRNGDLRVNVRDTESNPIHHVWYHPMISGTGVYDFVPANFRTFTYGTGTATTSNGFLVVSTGGTTAYAYGALQSFRAITVHSNEQAVCSFSAYFTAAVANTWQGVGFVGIGHELSFGYSGVDFGVWYRYGGRAEIRQFIVTTPGTTPNIDITINGVVLDQLATTGTTATQIASQIAAHITSQTTTVTVDQIGATVIVGFTSDGPKTGTFSITGDGSFASSGWTQTTAGVLKTPVHIPVSLWDNQNLGFTLDPSTGNNYKIVYKSGFSSCKFFIEDPNDTTGRFILVHTIHSANAGTTLMLENPSSRITIYSTNIDTAASSTSVHVFDIAAGIYGGDTSYRTRNPRAYSNTKSIATTLTNILSVRNKYTYNTRANSISIIPYKLTLANDGAKSAIFELRSNPTVAGTTEFNTIGTNLVAVVDTAGTTVSSDGRPLAYFSVSKGQSITVDLIDMQITIPPTLVLVIAGRMISGTADDLTVALTWYEDV